MFSSIEWLSITKFWSLEAPQSQPIRMAAMAPFVVNLEASEMGIGDQVRHLQRRYNELGEEILIGMRKHGPTAMNKLVEACLEDASIGRAQKSRWRRRVAPLAWRVFSDVTQRCSESYVVAGGGGGKGWSTQRWSGKIKQGKSVGCWFSQTSYLSSIEISSKRPLESILILTSISSF